MTRFTKILLAALATASSSVWAVEERVVAKISLVARGEKESNALVEIKDSGRPVKYLIVGNPESGPDDAGRKVEVEVPILVHRGAIMSSGVDILNPSEKAFSAEESQTERFHPVKLTLSDKIQCLPILALNSDLNLHRYDLCGTLATEL